MIGDVHGRAATLAETLAAIREVPRVAGLGRMVVFLGDVISRGEDSIGAVRLVCDAANLALADHAFCLPGNHELMLLESLQAGADPAVFLESGGERILVALDPDWEVRPWPGMLDRLVRAFPDGWVDDMASAPSHLVLGDVVLVHAGLHPTMDRAEFLDRSRKLGTSHWAMIGQPAFDWPWGWDRDETGRAPHKGPTVVIHGHVAVIRSVVTTPEDLAPMDRIDRHRTVCLDAGASRMAQIGWAHMRPGPDHAEIGLYVTRSAGLST